MIGYIYRLEGGGKFYIGSTTCDLKYRLKKHRSKSNEDIAKTRRVYQHFKQLGWSNATMILISEVNVQNKRELLLHEKDELLRHKDDENCLNTALPLTTEEEKKKRNHEYQRRLRQENPERERLRLQKWRLENPEKRKEQSRRERMKKTA
jgi:predicted GIY-YIG superfamily endonuclease